MDNRGLKVILFALGICMLCSCEINTPDSDSPSKPSTEEAEPAKINSTEENSSKQNEGRISKDTLRFNRAFQDAWKKAELNLDFPHFSEEYDFYPDDSSYAIKIEILIGNLFTDSEKYFLLRRRVPWATYLNLYQIRNGKAFKILERKQSEMSYRSDTIFDVNGDQINDFVVHWHPVSGCCRRNIYSVYLKKEDRSFSTAYRFINPTFSPEEHIIRGISYGHPGEAGLYKFKWNGLAVDSLEFIYRNTSRKDQFIKTSKAKYKPTASEGELLKEIPEEYLQIESIDWFEA